ncbi:MAG: DHHW family protein [Synergistaceae bacterium]|nr:DHHW family protein [Synergistaceae bacterium]
MEQKTTKIEKVCAGLCIAILCFFAVTIATRYLCEQILTKGCLWNNAVTRLLWFDNAVDEYGNGRDKEKAVIIPYVASYLDWASIYPFDKNNTQAMSTSDSKGDNTFEKAILDIEAEFNKYASESLAFYKKIIEAANIYVKAIGWNFVSFKEYNGTVKLADEYLTSYCAKKNVTDQFNAIRELNDYCKNNKIDFLYVQTPSKISQYDDKDMSGFVDFANQNANELLQRLRATSIDTFDIREAIHKAGFNNHSLFYRTDHHWRTTTGIWAAQQILKYCCDKYGWTVQTDLLNLEQFRIENYPNSFLGSQGKKVTLARATPDDFSLLYPKYETKFRYKIYNFGIDKIGDYSVCYDMNRLGHTDYYVESSYHTCNYGDKPLIEIENLLNSEDKKILIIRDSFGDCLISGLALGVKHVYSLDLRLFTGSVKRYIKKVKPDLVIAMYSEYIVGDKVDYKSHTDMFDFR